MLHFDPSTGLYVDTESEVREIVRDDWIAAFQKDGQPELDTDPETPAGQLIDSETAHIIEKDNELLFLAQQFNPLTAEGIWQDALGKIYFLTRKQHQHSIAYCTITGLAGTVIPIGARIRSNTDNSVWICSREITIPESGSIVAPFVAENHGPITAGSETLTNILTLVPGWDSVTNLTAANIGRNTETQMEFEARRYASVAANARGSLAAIYGTLSNIQDVLDCVVLENTTSTPITEWGVTIPGHSIWAAVVGGKDADIAEAIYRKKDAGCGTSGNTIIQHHALDIPGEPVYTYKIERPEPIEIGIKIRFKETATTPADIDNLIREALIQDFAGAGPHGNLRVGMAQNVYASRFYCAVINAGANGLETIELAAPASDGNWSDMITINADKNPVLDRDNIFITMVR